MRPKLTDDEREIRRSRGIAIIHFWPFALMLLANFFISSDTRLLLQCTGRSLDGGGRAGAAIRIAAAIPCSIYDLQGSPFQIAMFACFWLPIPFAIVQILWMRRHAAYWDGVRAREKIKRAEKTNAEDPSTSPP